ncbi:TetR/AcrR family transcriptional regulator [Tomitella gaofuii]|uniref:TetR/AcrR family transcriptional regulator n=1 Tax=Tomitella gaofuii TaxID=2760083 RepID=UPI0015FB8B6F|nr:TetR/AcrR family transcriptional regulator [Tomitella gaofuii]
MTTPQTTPDRILDALERVLLREGPGAATLEAVAADAGVSKGGLLYHFSTKEAMLAAMVRRLGARSDAELDAAVAGGTTVAEFYLQALDNDSFSDKPLYQSAIAALRGLDGRHEDVQAAMTEVLRGWDAGLQKEFDDPVDAEIVRLVGDGILLSALLDLPAPDPDLHARVVARLLGRA